MNNIDICKTCKNYKYRLSVPPKNINKSKDFSEWEKLIPCRGCVHWGVSDLYEADVKLCPFCGGEAELKDLQAGTNHSIYVAGCGKCSIFTKPYTLKEDAIKSWNKRV